MTRHEVPNTTAREAFRKAAEGHITTTNLGGHVQVDVKGVEYTIIIHDNYRAVIQYESQWGNTSTVHHNATPTEDRALRARWKVCHKRNQDRHARMMRQLYGR